MTAVTAPERVERMPQPPAARPLAWLRERGMGASILVAAISSAFGALLLTATGYLAAIMDADPYIGDSETLAAVLVIMTVILVGVAVYVAAIVTANTFSTIVAGRTRRIALMRLIGASAYSQRNEIARQGLVIGAIGAVVGLLAGMLAAAAGIALAEAVLGVPDVGYSVVQAVLAIPAIIVVLTTWAAAWVGSRRVLTVTPLQALGGSVEASHDSYARRRGRNGAAIGLFASGAALLAAGIVLGLVSPLGVVVAFFGGLLSFTGLVLGSTMVMPPVLRLVGRLFGDSATSRLAAENALRYPERSSRMAIGVVIGVTLVTMFAVALETVKAVVAASGGGEIDRDFEALLDMFAGIMMGLVAVSAVIAAVGLVNLLTIGVVQRRRELGLLRSLGVSTSQVRRMVMLEAAHITIAAVVTGLVLGTVYGWAGAQSVLGSVAVPPAWQSPTFVAPAVPWLPIALIVVATAVLTLVAAVVPTRLATRVAPIEALAD
ncbi:FtsX-like permease family protein [Microbacterium sp. NPDC056003]|uniref:ABC transporter permease n=1 Tax=Microbacterium sp. NPDC056003 TaxID=3345676 RepID=UPI0035DC95D9